MPAVLITGGHGGIGFECAKHLVSKHGADLVLAGRSPERMAAAAEQLKQLGKVKVHLLPLDTSSLASVREAASQCKHLLDSGKVDALQAVICNAGGRFDDLAYSSDGYERTFATNYLGHSLLVDLLIDRVAPQGRVVFTASGTHDPDTTDGKLVGKVVQPDAAALANTGKGGGTALGAGKRYTTSKLCMVLYTYELARRLERSGGSIAAIAYDPGSVPDSGFLSAMPAAVRWLAASAGMKWLTKQMGVTPGDLKFSGTSLADLAVDSRFAGFSGKYFQSNDLRLIERRSATLSYDESLARKLWTDSRQLTQLRLDEASALLP